MLVQKSGVCFLILFVLVDAILLSLHLQNRTSWKVNFFDENQFLPLILTLSEQNEEGLIFLSFETKVSQSESHAIILLLVNSLMNYNLLF